MPSKLRSLVTVHSIYSEFSLVMTKLTVTIAGRVVSCDIQDHPDEFQNSDNQGAKSN